MKRNDGGKIVTLLKTQDDLSMLAVNISRKKVKNLHGIILEPLRSMLAPVSNDTYLRFKLLKVGNAA